MEVRTRGLDRHLLGVLLLAGLAALALSCLYRPILPREPGLHPRLTPYAYVEQGRLIALGVDTEAARQREDRALVPFGVGVANIGLRRLTLNRESLTLVDESGRRYAMATLQEVRSAAVSSGLDLRQSERFFGVWAARFEPWPMVENIFFPRLGAPGSPLVRDRFELHRRAFSFDLIYFPHPEGKLLGQKLEMWIDAEELPEPTFVKFRIR